VNSWGSRDSGFRRTPVRIPKTRVVNGRFTCCDVRGGDGPVVFLQKRHFPWLLFCLWCSKRVKRGLSYEGEFQAIEKGGRQGSSCPYGVAQKAGEGGTLIRRPCAELIWRRVSQKRGLYLQGSYRGCWDDRLSVAY